MTRRGDERGTTVIEMMVTLMVLALVVGIFGPTMTSALTGGNKVEAQSRALDQLRLATIQIGRELRSADCISQPAVPSGQSQSAPGSTLDFTTFANNASPAYRVAYTASGGTLTRTTYDANGNATGSRMVAQYLVNSTSAFTQISTPRRSVLMTFNVQVDPQQSPRVVTTTIGGRNAWKDTQCGS